MPTIAPYTALPASWRAAAAGQPGAVLLETCRFDAENHRSYLFLNPVHVLVAQSLEDVPVVFSAMEQAQGEGRYVAGYLAYESGFAFEPRLSTASARLAVPLAWFGVYEKPFFFDHRTGPTGQATDNRVPLSGVVAENVRMGIAESAYRAHVERIRDYIAAGDVYQVNFTDRVFFKWGDPPLALYEQLRGKQRVSYAAYLNLGDTVILSLSPELFFRREGRRLLTRPMKGTAPRGRYLAEDADCALQLARSEKERAENVMIVDLMRNDMGRLCEPGSVRVERLFEIERYESLLQMVSTITGRLRPGITLTDIVQAMFPSGSVTGAPKIRAMEIIRELETRPRGVYTGAIGFAAPSGNAVFNVAIRTVALRGSEAEIGVGGGITFDSEAGREFSECWMKANFVLEPTTDFQLIETIRLDGGYSYLESHLARLQASAEYFGFPFNWEHIRRLLADHAYHIACRPAKVRLLLARDGRVSLSYAPVDGSRFGKVAFAPVRTHSADRFLFHKTTRRELYDRLAVEAKACGLDDYVFVNERREITEGTHHNVFVELNGRLYTPPIVSGLLPGICRGVLLQTCAHAEERVLTPADLRKAEGVFICNAIAGLQPVILSSPPATL